MTAKLRALWYKHVDFERDARGFGLRLYLPGFYAELYLDKPTHEVHARVIYKDP